MAEPRRVDGLTIEGPDSPPCAVLRVRGALDAGQASALSDAFGLAWPATPNTSAARDGAVAAWLAPGEWAVIGQGAAETRRLAGEALGETLRHVADVGDGRVTWRLEGLRARDVLAMGCGLDLHPRAFGPGAVAMTLFAQVSALIRRCDEGDRYELTVDAGLAEHVRHFLTSSQEALSLGLFSNRPAQGSVGGPCSVRS